MSPRTPAAPPPEPPTQLDISDPERWQMPVRVYLESLGFRERERWVQNLALINRMAGHFTQQGIAGHWAEYCFVCGKPFKDGKPAGDAQYYNETNTLIVVHYCAAYEMSECLKMCALKEEDIRRAEERASKAARQAAIDARASNAAKARQLAEDTKREMMVRDE